MYFLLSKKTTLFDNFPQMARRGGTQGRPAPVFAANRGLASPGTRIVQFVAIARACLRNKLNLCA
jgi:hypothetical protein